MKDWIVYYFKNNVLIATERVDTQSEALAGYKYWKELDKDRTAKVGYLGNDLKQASLC